MNLNPNEALKNKWFEFGQINPYNILSVTSPEDNFVTISLCVASVKNWEQLLPKTRGVIMPHILQV